MANDLLAGLEDETSTNVLDLLDGIDESGGTSWVPESVGDGIQGNVKALSTTSSDYSPEPVPVVVVDNAKVVVGGKDVSGDAEEWRITAYASVLSRELKDSNLSVGDLLAVKFFGEKMGKSGNAYKHFKAASRAGAGAQAAKAAGSENKQAAPSNKSGNPFG